MTTTQMSPKEFWEKGYLQEANRKFFHPLGLAISIEYNEEDDDPVISLGPIYVDDDPEGWCFPDGVDGNKAIFIHNEAESRREAREALFGGVSIQPIDWVLPAPEPAEDPTDD